MPIGLLGRKIGMTRVHDATGTITPVTIIEAGPCPILQIKNKATDGYAAVQLGFDPMPERNVNRPMAGHFKRAGAAPVRLVREFRIDDLDGYEAGKTLDLSLFEVGEQVDIVGKTKGRGFASHIKRFHSHRGPTTHGSTYHRLAGALGASGQPAPAKDEAYYLAAARAAFESGKFEPALRLYSKVLEYNPQNADAWTGQVRMLIELGEFREAKLWADKALERFPHEPELLA